MYKNEDYNVKIYINLENGVYNFTGLSATGKTRLCKLLRDMEIQDKNVIGYTFEDEKLGINLENQIDKLNPKVIMLDRFDLYKDKFTDKIEEWGKNSIVLVDCKGNLDADYDYCSISLYEDKIEVD